MSQLDLTIGGRTFAIAVQPGGEEHLLKLGAEIEAKFKQLGNRYSQNLLFASLHLADELHNARVARDRIEAESAEAINGMDALKREADLAVGQADNLRERVAELEAELDRMQSANQSEANKYNDLMQDNERFKIAVMEADAEKTALQGELATAKRESDAMRQELAQLRNQASDASQPSFINPAVATNDPELAPSLERFAELLEQCADKLEGSGLESEGTAP